jgi:hypothetical protein
MKVEKVERFVHFAMDRKLDVAIEIKEGSKTFELYGPVKAISRDGFQIEIEGDYETITFAEVFWIGLDL